MRTLLLVLLFIPFFSLAQPKEGKDLVDSLLAELPKTVIDSNKANLMITISYNYYNINPDIGIKYGKEGLDLATKISSLKLIARANTYLGANYYSKAEYPTALEYWLHALKLYEQLDDKKEIANNLLNTARIYVIQGNANKSLDYYQKALAIYQNLNKPDDIAKTLGNIGSAYVSLNDYTRAVEYYNKALAINIHENNKNGISDNVGNIGAVYFNQSNYSNAMPYYFQALRMNSELNDKTSVAINLGNIGECYLFIAKDTTGKIIADSLIPAGRQANLKKSVEYFNKCISTANEIGNMNIIQNFAVELSEAHSLSGDYKEALNSYRLFVKAKDSVFNVDNNIKITNLETKRELELKDKQIELDRLAVAKKRNERYFFIAGIIAMMIVSGNVFRNYRRQKKTNYLLSLEKKKSEDLLLNILPEEIAVELKEKGTATARQYDNVTVLFTDFINFTTAGERMTPQELVGELDTCFKGFDDILSKYNIEKIKTIGDAYLAVSGLPAHNPRHAQDIVSAALEIRDYMKYRQEKLGDHTFGIRIGIHSGSVVAGIIGVRKFAYDIWGDTVNTAARMEQNSRSGHINISEVTYQLVKDEFHCTHRGKMEAKNKGAIDMYFVDGHA